MKSVPVKYYNKEYYYDYNKYCTLDARLFLKKGEDKNLPLRLSILKKINIKRGIKVLDLGCGRGEGLIYFIKKGAIAFGIDYSKTALRISKKTVSHLFGSKKCFLAQANAQNLPFRDKSFKIVFMGDVVEHLYPLELNNCLKEVNRVLSDDGQLVLRTGPNRWYYDYGYKIYRILRRLNDGTILDQNPRSEWDYKVHVNEQTYFRLKIILKKHGFKGKIWLDSEGEINPKSCVKKSAAWFLYKSPLKFFFVSNIYGILEKQ